MKLPILLAAREPEILYGLLSYLDKDKYLPMATRSIGAVNLNRKSQKIPMLSIVYEDLEDGSGITLCQILANHPDTKESGRILLTKALGRQPRKTTTPFHVSLRWPSPKGIILDHISRLLRERDPQLRRGRTVFAREINQLWSQLDNMTYYSVLGLTPDSPIGEIIKAYDQMSIKFHPDRHIRLQGSSLGQKCKEIYMIVLQAYQILTNPEDRKKYNEQISEGHLRLNPTSPNQTPEKLEDLSLIPGSRKFLGLAQTSLDSQNTPSALINIQLALNMDPNNEKILSKIDELKNPK